MLNKEKFKLLHSIRGFAALMVVIGHAKFPFWCGGTEYVKKFPQQDWNFFDKLVFGLDMFSSNPALMVIVFFVLSGFFIAYSFENNKWKIRHFYTNRAIRYHYPELWLTAVYINFFNVQPLISHVIFVHIILAVILTIGIIALSEEIDKRIIFKILGILSLFFGGIVIFSIIPQTKFYIDYRSIIFPKFIIISLFFVWFILLFLRKSRDLFYPLLALPIINITLAPVIFTSIILYLLVISIIYKNFVNQLKPIILTIFFALCIWIFYFIQKKIEIYGLPVSEIIKINKSQPLQILNVFVASFIIYFSVFIWYFIPGIFIYYKNRNRELKDTIWYNIFLFGFIILFSGSFFWAILNPLHDSNQFYVLPVYFFSNILISLLFLLYLKKSYNFGHIVKKLFYLYLLFIIFINIYNIKYNCVFFKMRDIKSMYSKEYIDKIFAVIKCEDEIPNIGTIYSRIDIYYSFDAQVTITYLPPIDNMIPFHNTVNLNSPYDFIYRTDSYKIIKRSENIINNNLFIKYLKKENYNEKNIDELRIRFIKENNIKYLVLKKGYKLPPIYDEIVKEQYYDNITGENFVILSY